MPVFDFNQLMDKDAAADSSTPADVSSSTGESFVTVSGGVRSVGSSIGDGSPRNGPAEVVLLGENLGLCLGLIGKGETICVDSAAKCTIESHRNSKPDGLAQCILVKKGSMAAFLTPTCPAAKLSLAAQDWMLCTTLTSREDWDSFFVEVMNLSTPVSLADIKNLDILKELSDVFAPSPRAVQGPTLH
mmetsp:Transcript_3248/g.4957  ORF Transcript_3248/g.4957 Transcript_3248/m.4957 type:complete len:188 (-) Transcript_3248:3535-4098(-)